MAVIAPYPEIAINQLKNARDLALLDPFVSNRVEALEDEIDRLTERIVQLEARGEMKYLGVWQRDQQYERGNFCSLDGAMWHAEMRTRSRPGTDATWRLAVKAATFSPTRQRWR